MGKRQYRKIILMAAGLTFCLTSISQANELKLDAALTLQEECNNNVFFSKTDRLDDFISTVSPAISFSQNNPRLNLELLGRLDSILYADNDELNDIEQHIDTTFQYRLDPRTSFLGEYYYDKDIRPDRDIETTGLLLGTNIRYSRLFKLTGSHELSEKTVSALTYSFEDQDFEDPDLADFDTHLALLTVSHDMHALVPSTRARFNFRYIFYDYPNIAVNYYSATLGASYEITEASTLLLDLGAGYTRKNIENALAETAFFGEDERESGFTGQFTLAHQDEFTKNVLSFSHELRAASGKNAITERTSLNYDIARKFTSEFRGSFRLRYYINQAGLGELSAEDIDTRTLSIIPGISYKISDEFFFEVIYNYSKIEDRVDDSTAQRNLFLVRLIAYYPLFK